MGDSDGDSELDVDIVGTAALPWFDFEPRGDVDIPGHGTNATYGGCGGVLPCIAAVCMLVGMGNSLLLLYSVSTWITVVVFLAMLLSAAWSCRYFVSKRPNLVTLDLAEGEVITVRDREP